MLKSKVVLAIISGILLSLSWPTYGFPVFLFFAFVPLFILEEEISKESHHKNRKIFFYSYLAIFIWNVITTWWIWNSTAFGAIMAVILNSLFMSLVWVIFSFSKRHFFNQKHAIFLLPIFWVAFEYLHLDWDLSWSWLNLGNAFANHIYAIQWYEYTGTFGGTWWVLIVNILIFKLIQKMNADAFQTKKLLISSIPVLLFIFIPLSVSFYIYKNFEDQGKAVEFVVVQPNMDPWSEQFMSPPKEVIQRMIDLSKPLISEDTRFWLAPESAIQEGLKEPKMTVTTARGTGGVSIPMLQEFMAQYPDLQLVVGASTYRFLKEETATSRQTENGSIYDEYNTAILMNSEEIEDIYHKSKLVPGPEKMPFPSLLKPLQNIAFDLGGAVGSLGYDSKRKVFYSSKDSIGIAPLICYESIYGGFVAEFVRNGAQILAIITNDGWWGNTQGHQQHLAYARLRAIECRRSVARSANTGISGFINQKGELIETTTYWVQDARKATIYANSQLTFFVKHGDFLGRISAFLTALFLLISVTVFLKKDKINAKSPAD